MFGEPVSRAPIESINPEANSITFESRKPSYRIRPIVSKSTFSSDQAAGINQPAMKNDTSTDWISRFMKQAPEGSSKRGLYSQGSRGNRGQICKVILRTSTVRQDFLLFLLLRSVVMGRIHPILSALLILWGGFVFLVVVLDDVLHDY